jgi:LysM repeat protein
MARERAGVGGDDWTAEEVLAEVATPGLAPSDPDVGPETPDPATWLPALEGRSTKAGVCPFLRSVGGDGAIGTPADWPDVANRCAALHEAVPQSLRQQELVCLTPGHINCPRYLRGALVAAESPVRGVRIRTALTPAISAALVILVLSFGASIGFIVSNGGLTLPTVSPRPTVSPASTAAAAVPTASTSAASTARPSAAPSVAPASPTAPPSGPAATSIATPAATPKPTKTAKPKPTSNRYALLKPCPNKPDCWIYTIRSGDNLFSIANYFGVPLERIRALNPWTRTERLRAGRELILPPPTR